MNRRYLLNSLVAATTAVLAATHFTRTDRAEQPSVADLVTTPAVPSTVYLDSAAGEVIAEVSGNRVSTKTQKALAAFGGAVRGLSHPRALESAFLSYFAFQSKHPDEVKKPLLYFVDYGLSASKPRGYVFDMKTLTVVDGPFLVAHGRGSAPNRAGIPTRFSNANGSAATSLGLYLAQETYGFSGKASGRFYRSVGLRLKGLSGSWNNKARERGVVAHGAPYVTKKSAGRSEGCPAVDQERAKWLMPRLAQGGLVFLFAPNEQWLATDPWLAEGRG